MRVLICDQESEMLEMVARWFEVDTATSKATCIDLMRANPFDVVVASERLSDGSGLELLSDIGRRWPNTLRVLVMEPERLRLLRGKLGPFKLHATMRYPIEEEELETVLNRMGELLVEDSGAEAEEEPEPPPPPPPPVATSKVQKVSLPQQAAKPSSPGTRASSQATSQPRQSSRTAQAARPLGAPVPPEPPVVRRKLGNYTPLGAVEDKALRIVERQFDQTIAPLAAKAIRSREEATRPRTQKEKLGTLRSHLTDALKRLLKR